MKILVTAGPTREFIDPVRFLSNPSTGRMGFSIARIARLMGHEVTLVAGPVGLKTPKGVKRIDIVSAREMLAAAEKEDFDCMIATAAVADWRPADCASEKLKKSAMDGTLRLVRNPDVLKTISKKIRGSKAKTPRKILVGFAAETGDPTLEASRKCREKGLDFVVANDVTAPGCGFGVKTNRVSFVWPDGRIDKFPTMSKDSVARRIIRAV
ncbi:MAG: bifunctional 4'-phosphopantothenoylcysteine decarboxylase/phosphopantothenoylcysteine synthetase, partial [Kiritimatiellae bacterium]|nr:bifunctional 4'-phosphopantothenoylcysteine decarboxylase/phosphopantothenoylcysteine synthetase [Kiritimatiellia bacterium]